MVRAGTRASRLARATCMRLSKRLHSRVEGGGGILTWQRRLRVLAEAREA
jgi:hypothetical protein